MVHTHTVFYYVVGLVVGSKVKSEIVFRKQSHLYVYTNCLL